MSSIALPLPALEFNTETACEGPQEPHRMIRILIADPIAQEGTLLLRSKLPEAEIDERFGLSPEQLRNLIGGYTVLIVRSETRVTDDLLVAAQHLKIIGRAGAGTDTIDLEAATRRGIVVVNAPRGSVIAAAEHTIAMMMALARHIPVANNSTKAGKWEKSRFQGVELAHKVLGILGLGKVGKEVAKRAQGLAMQVLASDPSISTEQASRLGVPLLSMEEVLSQADFLTLHAALREGHLAGVALDVFSQEPIGDDAVLRQLLSDTRVIATPHLGASTAEAQVRIAREVAQRIVLLLLRDRLRATMHISFPPAHT